MNKTIRWPKIRIEMTVKKKRSLKIWMMPNINTNLRPEMITVDIQHWTITIHNQEWSQLETRTGLDSHNLIHTKWKEASLRKRMVNKVKTLTMLNTNISLKPEMTIMVDTQHWQIVILNHQWSQLEELLWQEALRMDSLNNRTETTVRCQISHHQKTWIMPNSSINLKPEMITMVDIQL